MNKYLCILKIHKCYKYLKKCLNIIFLVCFLEKLVEISNN